MHREPLISVITTFFNEEQLLGRCLDSVKNQTYKNLEVILINDGSSDLSLEIANRYCSDFKLCKIISTQNSGHSESRNVGLKNATGEYVTFLDADDEFETRMISTFVQKINEQNSDLVICNITVLSEDGQIRYNSYWNQEILLLKETKLLIAEMYTHRISDSVWAKMFKTKIAQQISFEKGLWFDDRPYLLQYLHASDTVSFIDQCLLRIYRRNESITRRTLETKRIIDCHRLFELELSITKEYNTFDLLKGSIAKHQLDSLMDTFLIQIIERNLIINRSEIEKAYLFYIKEFKKAIRNNDIHLKFKDKIALTLLGLPGFLGWKRVNALMRILKRHRIQFLKEMKNV